MRVVAVTALAIMALSGCQVEEGEVAAEAKADFSDVRMCTEDDKIEYIYLQYRFPNKQDGHLAVNFRFPKDICQELLKHSGHYPGVTKSIELCLDEEGSDSAENLKSDYFQVMLRGPWDGSRSWTYISEVDDKKYHFLLPNRVENEEECNQAILKELAVRVKDGDDIVAKATSPAEVASGDIKQCWPHSRAACKTGTPTQP